MYAANAEAASKNHAPMTPRASEEAKYPIDSRPSPIETHSNVSGRTVLCKAPANMNPNARIANIIENSGRAGPETSKNPSSPPRRKPGMQIQYQPNAL